MFNPRSPSGGIPRPVVQNYPDGSPEAVRQAYGNVQRWDTYIGQLRAQNDAAAGNGGSVAGPSGGAYGEALAASAGFEREKLAAQVKDASAARANAMQIAKLQSETQRYGIDVARQTALDQLKENGRQFDLTHELEQKKFGLATQQLGVQYAQTATEYLSTPDRYFQGADFINMASRALNREGGPTPYGTEGTPTPKTEQDFAVLAGYTQPGINGELGNPVSNNPVAPRPMPHLRIPQGQFNETGSGGSVGITPGANGGTPAPAHSTDAGGYTDPVPGGGMPVSTSPVNEGGGQSTAPPDPRVKVLSTMFKNMPPSNSFGLDDNDYAVLSAARALYTTNNQPGTVERMRPGQQKVMASAGRRLGYDVDDWLTSYKRGGVGQGSARSA